MTVLVTGGCGFLGHQLVLALTDSGRNVVVLDRSAADFSHPIAGVAYEAADLRQPEAVDAIFRRYDIEQVAHLAASVDVVASLERPLDYYADNVEGTRLLAEACLRHGVRDFLFASTAAVYGDAADRAIDEDTPCHPLSPYGHSKHMAEQVLHDAARAHDLNLLIYRHFNAAGADPAGRGGPIKDHVGGFVRRACRAAIDPSFELTIFGTDFDTPDGTCVRDYIHVADVAEVQRLGLEALARGDITGLFNVGSGQATSVAQVVAAVERASGPLKATPGNRREGEIIHSLSSSERLMQALDWRPSRSDLDTIVRDALAWESAIRS